MKTSIPEGGQRNNRTLERLSAQCGATPQDSTSRLLNPGAKLLLLHPKGLQ